MNRDMRRQERDMRRRARDSRGRFMRDRGYENYTGDHAMGRGGRDGNIRRDRGMDYGMGDYRRGGDYGRYDMRHDYAENSKQYNAQRNRDYERSREYHGTFGDTPFSIMGRENYYPNQMDYRRGQDYGDYGMYDYGRNDYGEEKLEKEDIDEWVEKLLRELDPDEKEMFKMDRVVEKARQMGENFEHYSPEELYLASLMLYTDFKDILGKGNLDTYIHLGKAFLCDKDSQKKYGKKLSAYFDEVVGD